MIGRARAPGQRETAENAASPFFPVDKLADTEALGGVLTLRLILMKAINTVRNLYFR